MASLYRNPAGRQILSIIRPDGSRPKINLGDIPKRDAEEIRRRVESLASAASSRLPLDFDTARWVGAIGDTLAERLHEIGLIPKRESRAVSTLRGFIAAYIDGKPEAAARSVVNYNQAAKKLYAHFGPEREIGSITPAGAAEWSSALKRTYAQATAARLIKFAKQFFGAAKRQRVIADNPFDGIVAGSMTNQSLIRFVTREEIDRVLDACPDSRWRLIVALCRFGGLRCPSEIATLRWGDIDWALSRFAVDSSKTGMRRMVPLFPELAPHLQAEFERAEPGTIRVVHLPGGKESNLRRGFGRIVQRAGLLPWPRLFQNLRASRETELAADFPIHVASAWIGNSAAVAAKHYLSVRETDFARATGNREQNREHTPLEVAGNGWKADTEIAVEMTFSPGIAGNFDTKKYTPQEGCELSFLRKYSALATAPGAISGAIDDQLAELIAAWPRLPASVREAILRLAGAGEGAGFPDGSSILGNREIIR